MVAICVGCGFRRPNIRFAQHDNGLTGFTRKSSYSSPKTATINGPDERRLFIGEGGPKMKSVVVKRSIVIAGHKTSVSLEDAFWNGLKAIANVRKMSLSDLIASIDTQRQHANLSSAIRLFVLDFYQLNEDTPVRNVRLDMRKRSALSA
jgi:predicted DNA-binding ribbon-helix-helix protein